MSPVHHSPQVILTLSPSGAKHWDVGYQTIVSLSLGKGYFHALAVYLNMPGDDGDEFILQGLQQSWGDVCPVMHQHQL
jgi:hypothetical protein